MPPAWTGDARRVKAGHVDVRILRPGAGKAARKGDEVSVHYTGWLADGKKFDSSYDRDGAFEFLLGAGQVIPGWDNGLSGMKVGEVRRLILPPDQAYGEQGAGPVIPPRSTLVYQVELMGIAPNRTH